MVGQGVNAHPWLRHQMPSGHASLTVTEETASEAAPTKDSRALDRNVLWESHG